MSSDLVAARTIGITRRSCARRCIDGTAAHVACHEAPLHGSEGKHFRPKLFDLNILDGHDRFHARMSGLRLLIERASTPLPCFRGVERPWDDGALAMSLGQRVRLPPFLRRAGVQPAGGYKG